MKNRVCIYITNPHFKIYRNICLFLHYYEWTSRHNSIMFILQYCMLFSCLHALDTLLCQIQNECQFEMYSFQTFFYTQSSFESPAIPSLYSRFNLEDIKVYEKLYTIDGHQTQHERLQWGTKNTVWKSPCAKTVERISTSYEGNSCEINMANPVPPSELKRLCICFDSLDMSSANKTQCEWMLRLPE